jgi:glycosyltransferase involved in cell wall biosynthesis
MTTPRIPPVSVVIPAHDAAATIGALLRSLSPERDLIREILLVDDASLDDTERSAIAAADCHALPIEVVRVEVRNAGAARNIGLERCRGDFVFFIDADDELAPNGLRLLLDAMARTPGAGAAVGGTVRRTAGRPDKLKAPHGYTANRAMNVRNLLGNSLWPIAMGSALCTRESALKARFPEGLSIDEDTCYWAAIVAQVDIAAIPDLVHYYNLDEAKMSGRFVTAPRSEFKRVALALNRLGAYGIERSAVQRRKAWVALRMARGLLMAGDPRGARCMLRAAMAHPDFRSSSKLLGYRLRIGLAAMTARLRRRED